MKDTGMNQTQDFSNEMVNNFKEKRANLENKKPQAYEKLSRYFSDQKEGINISNTLVDWAIGLECNFRCTHCCVKSFNFSDERHMTSEDIKNVADQIDELGFFSINLIGGEPLIWKDLKEVLKLIDTSRFHVSLTTNGWFLTKDMCKHLIDLGVDKVLISIDSGIPEEHDNFRKKKGSFEKCIKAVENATTTGLRTVISTCVTHENVRSEGIKKVIEIANKFDIELDLQCATVSGGWKGAINLLLNKNDTAYLENIRKEVPLLRRDVWSTPDAQGGCPAVTKSLYIIPSGEVMPCLFMHISLGNVLKEPLKNIIERGMRVRELKRYSKLCLVGEDIEFIEKYMRKTFDAEHLPLSFEYGFARQKIE